MKDLLHKVVGGEDLTEEEMIGAMTAIMEGQVEPVSIAGFLTALKMKGETVAELVGAARVMRQKAEAIKLPEGPAVDTCGTGGDGADTFNISTTVAFVVAGAGVTVAKHGNRAVSSKSGSADVLKTLGVNIDADIKTVERCLAESGIGFLFAPSFHQSMKYAGPVRRELGFRTLFNLLGPVTNPSGVTSQVIGVFDERWVRPLAEVLRDLDCRHGFVVHGEDGLDEITLTCNTRVCELKDGEISEYDLDPTELGLDYCSPEELAGGSPDDNARIVRELLDGAGGPKRDIVLLNSAAALVAADVAEDVKEGLARARQSITSGSARQKLKDLCRISNDSE